MKTILITGTSRGLGRAIAQKFLNEGYVVIGTSTSGNADVQHENLKMFQLDLSNQQSIKRCADEIRALEKGIDILINNAGIAVEEEVDEPRINVAYVRKTLEVNLLGVIDFTERVIPLMNAGGQIVNVSSQAGSLGFTGYDKNYPAYRISKAALNMVTRILAVRLADKIKVSSIHPGWVKTDMGGEDADSTPEEVAENIFKFISSDIETGQFWFKGKKFPW
jgi:NAD(P)-dependent dehydrogenase (short-subunit alcohol dehydrogenase family)